ncbi:MAG TPA: alpha/beta fold hydrolase [Polyangiaceae bacterium]|nr:alpha/beta fold hydrolase [Polyangiaceae bacterium]
MDAVELSRPFASYLHGRHVRLVTFRQGVHGAPRLIWFPFGGGNALTFRSCARHLPASWGVYALDRPGQVRTEGEPLRDVERMRALYSDVIPWSLLNGSVLMGHSVGSYIALALAAELERRQGRARAVVIAAAPTPARRLRERRLSLMTADELFAWIDDMGALVGSSGAEGRQMFDLFEPALRADIDAYESFDARPSLEAPVLVLAGLQDRVCRQEDVQAWAEILPHARLRTIDDGHLFVLSSSQEVASHVDDFVGSTTE